MPEPLDHSGIKLDIEALLRLRHVVRSWPRKDSPANSLPGGLVHKRRGRGLEAAEIRHFVDGDDVRLIDKNATARTGTLHVKSPHDERDQTALLIADFRPSMLWGTRRAFRSVAAAETLALMGWKLVSQGVRVALLAVRSGGPDILPPRGRDAGMVAAIGALTKAHAEALRRIDDPEPELAPSLRLARELCPRGTSVFLASALERRGEDFDAALRALDHVCPVTVLRIADAFELEAPKGRFPIIRGDGRRMMAKPASLDRKAELEAFKRWNIAASVIDSARAPEQAPAYAPEHSSLIGGSHG